MQRDADLCKRFTGNSSDIPQLIEREAIQPYEIVCLKLAALIIRAGIGASSKGPSFHFMPTANDAKVKFKGDSLEHSTVHPDVVKSVLDMVKGSESQVMDQPFSLLALSPLNKLEFLSVYLLIAYKFSTEMGLAKVQISHSVLDALETTESTCKALLEFWLQART